MATKNYQQPLTPDSTEADEYIRQIRAQRLAQLLNQEAQAPIDYDPRGAISQSQLLAKALAGSGSILANAQADRQAAEMMAAKNAQQRALFSGQGGMGGNPFMPNNMSGEQSRYMLQNNPDKYWEMVANNNQITNEQKNAQAGFGRGAGNYMQAQQLANLQKQEGEAAKAGLIEMGQGQTLFNAQTGAPQYATNQLFNQDLGNRRDIVAANPLSGQSGVVRSDAVGVDPNTQMRVSMSNQGMDISDADALTSAMGIMKYGDTYKKRLFGTRAVPAKVAEYVSRLERGENPSSMVPNVDAEAVTQNQREAVDNSARTGAAVKGRSYWQGGGKGSALLTNAETVGRHVRDVESLIGGLHTGDIKALNAIGNAYGAQVGSEPLSAYKASVELAAPELSKLVTGNNNALRDREDTKALFDPNAPEPAKRAALNVVKNMAYDRFVSYGNQFKRDTNTQNDDEFVSVIGDPYTRQLYLEAKQRNAPSAQSNAAEDAFNAWKKSKGMQ